MKDDKCIFCKIANGEIPSKTLFEDEKMRVFLVLGPATKGHCLVVPKDHYADLFEVPADTLAVAFSTAQKVGAQLKEKLQADGVNIVQNNGAAAGQTVAHFHIHVIPRYENDGQTIGWNPGELAEEDADAVLKTFAE